MMSDQGIRCLVKASPSIPGHFSNHNRILIPTMGSTLRKKRTGLMMKATMHQIQILPKQSLLLSIASFPQHLILFSMIPVTRIHLWKVQAQI